MESNLPEIEDFKGLILSGIPLLDVRAPLEFAEGTLPTASNLPLIDDQQRHEIGLCYAHLGQDAAIDLGHELVTGELKKQRIAAWKAFAESHPGGVLYCWRGGMRSKITQQWLYDECGIRYPRIKGGYKAVRRYLIEASESISQQQQLWMLGGRTGSGKTLFLDAFSESIDLEGAANHRGSAFGPRATPQPNQVNFENQLAIQLIHHQERGYQHLILEDEGRNIGTRSIPIPLYKAMREAPLILLEISDAERITITYQEYIIEATQEFVALYGDKGEEQWARYLLSSLDKIRKRLGGQRHQEIRSLMEQAIATSDKELHQNWIRSLLLEYYDPMYDYQIEKRRDSVCFSGNREAVSQFLTEKMISKID